jgi:uncharacterized damage-inducible protein DinB
MRTNAMREIERIVEQLQRVYDGDAWYGPSVRASLEGVDAADAIARPIPSAHTICEIVLHVTAWTHEVARRLRTGVAQDPEPGDWPVRTVATDREWQAVLTALEAAQTELMRSAAACDDARLNEKIGDVRDRALGSGVSVYVTLHGLAQHHAYHAGQIALLKRALQVRGARA